MMYLLSKTRKIAPHELANHPFGQYSRDTQETPFLDRPSCMALAFSEYYVEIAENWSGSARRLRQTHCSTFEGHLAPVVPVD
jgi:hypothetical protein